MANEIGNGVKGKYMENMDYTIKNIEKLEDLKGYEWKHNGRKFCLDESISSVNKLSLIEKKYINSEGDTEDRRSKLFSEKNLTELEFYGLKVVLNEKPKLTRKERDFLEIHDIETYIARDESGLLVIGNTEPIQENDYWEWEENKLYLGESTFNFITWESGKAWSKTELMELEVVE